MVLKGALYRKFVEKQSYAYGKKQTYGKEQVKVRKIGLVLILQWLLIILFAIAALGFLISGKFMAGILSFLIAVVLYPNLNNILRNYMNIELSRLLRIVIIIILLFGIGFTGSQTSSSNLSTNSLNTQTTTSETTTQKLITKSLDEMLPTRNDISTEWSTGSTENLTLQEEGFIEGKQVSYYKVLSSISGAGIDADFYVRRFSNSDTAKIFYDKIVNKIKSEGGYKEISITDCFAFTTDMGIEESGESLCTKSNIVYGVYVYTDYIGESPNDDVRDFTNLLKNKVMN